MDEEIKVVALTLAALDGMPPEHFHAHDEAFRLWYYRRARSVIEGGMVMAPGLPDKVIEICDAASCFPAPKGVPCYPSAIDNEGLLYFAPLFAHRRVRELRVGGIPWDRVSDDPTPGQWRQDCRRGTIALGGITGGCRVIAYLEQ